MASIHVVLQNQILRWNTIWQDDNNNDVLFIGGDSAGFLTAIEDHDAGANLIIISRRKNWEVRTVICMKTKS
jgi:ribulose 1,5-bisphosphate synthetase/thiazole synthase